MPDIDALFAELGEKEAKATPLPREIFRGGNFTNFGSEGFLEYCNSHHNSATDLKIGSIYWPSVWSVPDEEWEAQHETAQQKAEARAEFIVAACNAIPVLREAHEAQKEQIRQLEAALRATIIAIDQEREWLHESTDLQCSDPDHGEAEEEEHRLVCHYCTMWTSLVDAVVNARSVLEGKEAG